MDDADAKGPDTNEVRQRVAMGNVVCHATVDYRYFGERGYREGSASISRGELKLDLPENKGRIFYGVVSMSGGGVFPYLVGNYPSRANPRAYPSGELEIGLGHWPKLSDSHGVRFEYRLGLMQSVTPAETIDPGVIRPIPYTRFLVTAAFYSAWQGTSIAAAVGGGLSAVWGRPTRQADAQIFDPKFGSFDFGVRSFFDLRVRVAKKARLELFLRHWMLFFEDDVRWVTDHLGPPELEFGFTTRNGLSAGLAVSL